MQGEQHLDPLALGNGGSYDAADQQGTAATQPTPPDTPVPLPYSGGQPYLPETYPSTYAGGDAPTFPGGRTETRANLPPGGFPPPPAYVPPAEFTLPPAYIPGSQPLPQPQPEYAPPAYAPMPAPAAPTPVFTPPNVPQRAAPQQQIAPAAPATKRTSTSPLVVEAILAFFGIYGVGWVMAGRPALGAILLALSVFWLGSAAAGTVITVGTGLACFGPANIVFLLLSVLLLRQEMRKR